MQLRDCLEQLHYHWFWGLRQVSETHEASLFLQVEAWKKEPQLVAGIREKQKKVSEKTWVIRLFYWLFNLSNYAENYYKLNAYDAVLMEEQGMFYLEKSKEVANYVYGGMVGFFKRGIVSDVIKLSRQSFSRSSNARHTRSEPSRECSEENAAPVTHVREKTLPINDTMLPHLQVIGLTCAVGDMISLIDIRKTYLRKAIATHPDKNPSVDTTSEFQAVLQAYEALKAMFEGRELISNTALWRTMDELSKDFQEIIRGYQEMSRDYQEMSRDYQEMSRDYQEMSRDYQEMSRDYQGITKICGQIERECKAGITHLDEQMQQIAEMNRMLDKIEREKALANQQKTRSGDYPEINCDGVIEQEQAERIGILEEYSIFSQKAQDDVNQLAELSVKIR